MKPIFIPFLASFLFLPSAALHSELADPTQGPSVNFKATLTGANTIPPNNSPFTVTATLTLRQGYVPAVPQPLLVSNLLDFSIRFDDSNFVSTAFYPYRAFLQNGDNPAENPGIQAIYYGGFGLGMCVPQPISGVFFSGTYRLTDEQVADVLAGQWYLTVSAATFFCESFPAGTIRGQILPADSDGDSVPDYLDLCPETGAGLAVDFEGCSIEQLCPCNGPWDNRQEYLKCVKAEALRFFKEGHITQAKRHDLLKKAQSTKPD